MSLRLIGSGGEDHPGGPSAWAPAPWRLPPSPPPLNLTHLRVVPPPLPDDSTAGDAVSGSEADGSAPQDPPGEPAIAAEPPPDPITGAVAPPLSDDEKTLRIRRLEEDLAASRDETEALHQMLEDLPEIFERKFRQRLQPLLEHQQRLIAENQSLREGLLALAPPAAVERPQLPPAREPEPPAATGPATRLKRWWHRLGRL